ncbi:hypothetical protein PVAND_006774 [Polypedilum vanderplanki]|uniref:Uncharacterized protein n=1 Tax=Polypedilum vanderplanki TaxID=319348 RepID=A0A9J6C4Q8_POLVA|nr:hypothetical protein PVAND_006774 [Polypedilum vanderplanki]
MLDNDENINLSLDEYIRRRKIKDQFSLLEMRKKDKDEIDKDELDASLDKIARQIEIARSTTSNKFDRFNDDIKSESSDDEEEKLGNRLDSDITMTDLAVENSSIRFAQEIEKLEHPECCKFKEFKTIENELGVKVRPQQWRLLQENLDRPKGVPRLVALPLNDEERKFKNGRVNKNYKDKNRQNVKAGVFVEKGNFTYKLDANGNDDDCTESLVGIVRNKPNVKVITNNGRNYNNRENKNSYQPIVGTPPININMNWGSFFKGFANCVTAAQQAGNNTFQPLATSEPPATQKINISLNQSQDSNHSNVRNNNQPRNEVDLQLKVAANDLLDYLINKRDKERKEQELKNMQQQFLAFEVNDDSDQKNSRQSHSKYPFA